MSEIGKRDHDFERAVEGMDEMTVLSMYYAQRNRAESAEQRAQRSEAKCKRLRREVEVLRFYGNKDCTAMADDALARTQ